MKLGIMQPYFFPYLGYFQLISAVDKFVVYDDVAFMKQGWVNRNRVLLHGQPHIFSVPLQGASSNRTIRDTAVSLHEYARWKDKFLKTIALAYSKAPMYEPTRALLTGVLNGAPGSIAELASRSILAVCRALALPTRIEPSSTIYGNSHLKKTDRLVDICRKEGANIYINAIGGLELYSKDEFAKGGIALQFLRTATIEYPQRGQGTFVPNLSVVDVMMNNTPDSVLQMLVRHELV